MADVTPDAARAADRGAGRARRRTAGALADARRIQGRAAARRHRQRQDRDLPAPRRSRVAERPPGAADGAGDRADAVGGGAVPRRLRRPRRHSAQRALRRRASRPVAAHPPRRRRHRRRHALGGVRAAVASRPRSSWTRSTTARTSRRRAPRYHGRDVAIVRASRERALVVLGSATPSMESYQNAATGKYARVTLERRVLDRPLASVRIVNMREEYADEGPDVDHQPRRCVAAIERSARAARAGAGAAQSPRLLDGGVLPPVRRHLRVPELQRVADRASRGPRAGAQPGTAVERGGGRAATTATTR